MTSRLAIDVMSGDYGSSVIIEGLVEAIRIYPEPFIVHLCGNKEKIRTDLKNAGIEEKDYGEKFVLEHCTDVIDSHDSPAKAWKKKSNSSIVKCIVLQDEGVVDASMSAGDTGMLMGAAIFILGRLKGIGRPALAAFLPNAKKRSSLILDVGANLNCRPGHLVNFGLLGYRYIKKFLDMPYPKVALLNIGEEPYKGTKNIYEADKELKRSCSGYTGLIEG